MNAHTDTRPPNCQLHDLSPSVEDFRTAVVAGLSRRPRSLSPKFFYDEQGSTLFDAITRLPEYYPTRTEIGLLRQHGGEIAAWLGHGTLLIEFGSGSEVKISTLLDALRPAVYMPIDISREHLWHSAVSIARGHPALEVHALCADYTRPFSLPERLPGLPRAGFYPGSSIGNFDPGSAVQLLGGIAELLGPGGRMLVGVDLKKDAARLHAAYNDAQGVTARFNLNLLRRMRDELGAQLEPDGFSHHAFYNAAQGRIEMHLVATRSQTIVIGDHRFAFEADEGIHTENSYKYSIAEFQALAAEAGFESVRTWQDEQALFSLHGLEVAGPSAGRAPGGSPPSAPAPRSRA
ncbi:L-histidine N(alpha)-methyltransferase [Rhodocyclaceae bacterium SMB388]